MIEGPAPPSIDLKARVYSEHPLPWTLEHDHIRDADGWAILSVDGAGCSPQVVELLVNLVNQNAGSDLHSLPVDGGTRTDPPPTSTTSSEEVLDSRALSPAPPPPKDSRAPEQPDSLLHPDRPSLLPHPLMLDLADVYGTLKPEFQEYEDLLPLGVGGLVPEWWPREEVEGQPLTDRERHGDFNSQLDETYRRLTRPGPSTGSSPSPPTSGISV